MINLIYPIYEEIFIFIYTTNIETRYVLLLPKVKMLSNYSFR